MFVLPHSMINYTFISFNSQICFLVTRISWLLSVLFDTLWCPPHTILVIFTIVCKEKNKSMWDELRYFTSDCRQISMRTDSMIGIGGTFSCSFTKNIITHFFSERFWCACERLEVGIFPSRFPRVGTKTRAFLAYHIIIS